MGSNENVSVLQEDNKDQETNKETVGERQKSCNGQANPKSFEINVPENHDYELIDNVYYYTNKESGIKYMYDQSKSEWVESSATHKPYNNEHSAVTTDEEGRKYYWAQGKYLCQDPQGSVFYMNEKNEWTPWSDGAKHNNEKSTENRWYYHKGDKTFYRDNSSNKVYILNKDKNEWEEYKKSKKRKIRANNDEEFDTDEENEEIESSDEDEIGDGNAPPGCQTDPSINYDGIIYTKLDPTDNMMYEWDPEKKAWFPKLDEDFMATYQLSYGFNPDGTKNENPVKYDDDVEEEEEEDKKKVKNKDPKEGTEKQKPGWFDVDDAHNKNVYVSNLPTDMTEDEFVEFMSKCGLLYKDPSTLKFKYKLYMDKDGKFKGDALCTYIKIESVNLALQILDGYRIGDTTVKVERAKFTLKGEYNPSLKPKKKRKKDLEKLQKKQEKLFDWRPDPVRGQRAKHEYVAIFRNVFDPKEFESAAERILTHNQAIRIQAETFGPVKKLELFDRHPEGVVKVTYAEVESADMCVATLNKRLYLNRKLFLNTWDGVEKYNVEETEEERKERIRKWEEFLEGK